MSHDSRYEKECPKHGWYFDEEGCEGCEREVPVSAPDVSPLALLLCDEKLLPHRLAFGSIKESERPCDRCYFAAKALLARGVSVHASGCVLPPDHDGPCKAVRVESAPPAGPWKAQPSNATTPWRVWAPKRKMLSDLSREEALAVRDALNRLEAKEKAE